MKSSNALAVLGVRMCTHPAPWRGGILTINVCRGEEPIEHVQAVVAVLPRPLAALVRLELLTGARPGDRMPQDAPRMPQERRSDPR
jgi:hypothetical protein